MAFFIAGKLDVTVAEITTQRKGEMIRTLFTVLAHEDDGLQAKDVIGRVEVQMDLTPFEKSTFPNNPDLVRFPKLLRFATISAVKAGWLRKKGGIWTLTDEGRAALQAFPDPGALYAESWRLYKDWKASQPIDVEDGGTVSAGTANSVDGDDSTEGGWIAAATLEEAEEAASRAIRDYLAKVISPYGFQDLVGKLLDSMGYHVVWIAPKGKDGGLDLLAQDDPFGVKGPRIKGQVKRREQKATEDELRSFLSLIEQNDVGVFISLTGFTRDAEELARRASRRITLIDGDAFLDLWVEHYPKIDEEGRKLLPIKRVSFLDIEA
jgi:restriction system protein